MLSATVSRKPWIARRIGLGAEHLARVPAYTSKRCERLGAITMVAIKQPVGG